MKILIDEATVNLALNALESWHKGFTDYMSDIEYQAITALRQAIEQAQKQEPVAWQNMAFARLGVVRDKMHPNDVATVQRFLDGDYAHPPQRTWVGLTEENVRKICGSVPSMREAVREAEAKLKECNDHGI